MIESHLEDRVVVIIGGTTGLGLSAAHACLRAGARIVACGRSSESVRKAQEAIGDRGQVVVGDARDPYTSRDAIELALSVYGKFDGLYHVAGGSGRQVGDGPLHEVTDQGIEATLEHNLKSVIFSNRAAVQAFRKYRTGGSVLNMGSVLGSSPSPTYFATHIYAAAKSAIIGFTKSCAAYYAPESIRFNLVAPALIETPMSTRAVGDDSIRQFIKGKQPLDGGRFGQPSDLDAAVVYFLSDLSRFVTGQVLAVDGGWCVSEGGPTRDLS